MAQQVVSADSSTKPSNESSDHYLLTALGTRAQTTVYTLDGRTAEAPLAPLALLQLLPPDQRPRRVVAVVTENARQTTWDVFRQGVEKILPNPPKQVVIPEGRNSQELQQILESVAEQFPPGCQLTLDVTQGLRHFPFVVYALALYLTSLQGVRLRGAYYGMLEGFGRDDPSPRPIVDLQLLLELPMWFHAVRVFRDYGTTDAIAQLIEPRIERLRQEARRNADQALYKQVGRLTQTVKYLNDYSFAYASGLVVELGKAGRHIADHVQATLADLSGNTLPLGESLGELISQAAQETAFEQQPPRGRNWKREIVLNKTELDRQARLIQKYLEKDQVALAVGLLREWVVSWAMWREGETDDWLQYRRRNRFEMRLGALAAFLRNRVTGYDPSTEQRQFGDFWHTLSDQLRNAFMHYGMRPAIVNNPPGNLDQVSQFWEQLREGNVKLPELGGGEGRLLISPQGNRPGVLFSALKMLMNEKMRPDRCLVICSKNSQGTVAEAARQAGFNGDCRSIVLEDPFGGFQEIEGLVKQAEPWLLEADLVLANLTGGTTLMGIVVQALADRANKLDRPIHRFALIDRRSPAEQDAQPYVQSEHYWLDPPPGQEDVSENETFDQPTEPAQ